MNQRLQVRTRRYWKECWTAGADLCCVTACRGRLGLLIDLEADGGKVCPQQKQQSNSPDEDPRQLFLSLFLEKSFSFQRSVNYLTGCSRDI